MAGNPARATFLQSLARLLLPLSVALLLGSAVRAETVSVDAAADRKAIDPRVYGVAYATQAQLLELNVPLHRQGGNNTSRYNWNLNADNRGSDWYFQSIGDSSAVAGKRGDDFIQDSRNGGAEPLLTIPMLDWVAKLGAGRAKLSSYSIAKYGAQTGNDWEWFPDAGNGVRASDGALITWNDPTDANVPAGVEFQRAWVQHLKQRWGTAANGGLRYYILDNEHSIWQGTHRDVHPTGATMDEIRDKMVAFGTMLKQEDPGALVVGPEEWGWSGYLFSGYDQQWGSTHGWSNLPDRANHGGADYLPWLLAQLKSASDAAGKRLLDVFTVHYYPQGGEFSNDVTTAMQQRRNRSTRSLWDPSYTDETWINEKVRLVPRVKEWVAANFPGLETGLTEYNWGAEGHINGATTQADILGIFGREGLSLAARWTTPATGSPAYNSIRMYRNYDGAKSAFGNVSCRATVGNPDNLSAFAAERSSDGKLTVLVINKTSASSAVTLNLSNFKAASPAQYWRMTAANTSIQGPASATVAGNSISYSAPAQSVTLFVISSATRSDFNADHKADVLLRHPSNGNVVLWLMK